MDVVDLEKTCFGGALTARNNLLTIIRTSDVFRINQLHLDLLKSLSYWPIFNGPLSMAKTCQKILWTSMVKLVYFRCDGGPSR